MEHGLLRNEHFMDCFIHMCAVLYVYLTCLAVCVDEEMGNYIIMCATSVNSITLYM